MARWATPDLDERDYQMLCPDCCRLRSQLIPESCAVCSGNGTITLGPAALAIYDPETVALAVQLTLTPDTSQERPGQLRTLALAGVIAAAPAPIRPHHGKHKPCPDHD